jgi:hypothetical protein
MCFAINKLPHREDLWVYVGVNETAKRHLAAKYRLKHFGVSLHDVKWQMPVSQKHLAQYINPE